MLRRRQRKRPKKPRKRCRRTARKVSCVLHLYIFQTKVRGPKSAAAAPSGNEDKGLEAPAPRDEDPDGLKLLSVSDPLEQAAKLLAPLVNLASDNLDAWIALYDVAIRRSKGFFQIPSAPMSYPDLSFSTRNHRKTPTSHSRSQQGPCARFRPSRGPHPAGSFPKNR